MVTTPWGQEARRMGKDVPSGLESSPQLLLTQVLQHQSHL